jgi:hypothetical protein
MQRELRPVGPADCPMGILLEVSAQAKERAQLARAPRLSFMGRVTAS